LSVRPAHGLGQPFQGLAGLVRHDAGFLLRRLGNLRLGQGWIDPL
jgi:hypothetical protein